MSGRATAEQEKTRQMIVVEPRSTAYHPVGFQLLTALLQLPHIDIEQEIERRSAERPSAADKEALNKRLRSTRYWLDNFAAEEDRLELQGEVPDSVVRLRASQRAFLRLLGDRFPTDQVTEDAYQRFLFDMARLTPIDHKSAFQALYRALLDKDQGPKGGALLSYLDAGFLIERFSEISYSVDEFWCETGVTPDACAAWIAEHAQSISEIAFTLCMNTLLPAEHSPDQGRLLKGRGVVELHARLDDDRKHMLRVLATDFAGEGLDLAQEAERLDAYGKTLMQGLSEKFRLNGTARAPMRITQE